MNYRIHCVKLAVIMGYLEVKVMSTIFNLCHFSSTSTNNENSSADCELLSSSVTSFIRGESAPR